MHQFLTTKTKTAKKKGQEKYIKGQKNPTNITYKSEQLGGDTKLEMQNTVE